MRRRGRRPRRRCKGRRRGATPRPAPARVAYVCVPAGTRNHFALGLGIERRIDLASVNGRVFVNNAYVGAYAAVVQSKAYRGAKLRTWARMLPALLGPNAPASELRLAVADGRGRGRPTFALVSNNPYRLSGIGGVGARPRLDTRQLGIVAAEIDGAADVAELLALATVGRRHRFRGFKGWSVRTFEVDSAAPVAVGLDGEALVLEPPLRFAALPGALRVRIPRRAHGGSPAAAAVGLTSRKLVALLRVAVGADASPTARRPLV